MNCSVCGKELTNILTGEIRNSKGKVYYCDVCDMGILAPSFQDAEEYYNKEYRKKFTDKINQTFEKPEEIFNMRKEFQKDRIKAITPFFDKSKTFLEIGCSAGQFISKINGNYKKIVGIEFDLACAEYVKNKWNIEVYTNSIEKVKWEEEYDNIAFFQVLEHVENPKQFLKSVYSLCAEEGHVFIEVPNFHDPLLQLWKIPAYQTFYYHEAHLSYFSEKALISLVRQCGFKIEDIQYHQDYNLLNNLYWYFNDKPQSDCLFGLSDPQIEFGNNGETGKAGQEINALIMNTNQEYIKILQKYKMTSNIFLIVKK